MNKSVRKSQQMDVFGSRIVPNSFPFYFIALACGSPVCQFKACSTGSCPVFNLVASRIFDDEALREGQITEATVEDDDILSS